MRPLAPVGALFSASVGGGRVSVRCSPSLGALQALSAFFEVEYDVAAAVEALAEALSRVSARCHPRDYMCVYSSAEALAAGLEDPQALSKALYALEDVFYIPRAAYVNRELGRRRAKLEASLRGAQEAAAATEKAHRETLKRHIEPSKETELVAGEIMRSEELANKGICPVCGQRVDPGHIKGLIRGLTERLEEARERAEKAQRETPAQARGPAL